MSAGGGGRNNGGFQQPNPMNNSGFNPTPRVGQWPGTGGGMMQADNGMMYGAPTVGGGLQTGGAEPYNPGGASMTGLPPQLAGTGGVRSPYGPYGPPGFIDGPIRTPPSGVGTTAQPNGRPAGAPLGPNDPAWFSTPQGMAAQWQAGVGNSPWRGLMPNGGQYPQPRHDPRPTGGAGGEGGYQSQISQLSGGGMAGRQAMQAANYANWQNPEWRMQQVLGGKISPTNNAEVQALLAAMPPEQRQAYIDKYRSIGVDPTFSGPATGSFGSGPLGS